VLRIAIVIVFRVLDCFEFANPATNYARSLGRDVFMEKPFQPQSAARDGEGPKDANAEPHGGSALR
jgi:hypothetical protein